jgi:hypothetical protein
MDKKGKIANLFCLWRFLVPLTFLSVAISVISRQFSKTQKQLLISRNQQKNQKTASKKLLPSNHTKLLVFVTQAILVHFWPFLFSP